MIMLMLEHPNEVPACQAGTQLALPSAEAAHSLFTFSLFPLRSDMHAGSIAA